MGLSVLELLSIELGALPANPAGVRFDRAEAAVMAEMDGWYADETYSLFGLAKKLQQDAVPPLRGRRNVTVHVAWNCRKPVSNLVQSMPPATSGGL